MASKKFQKGSEEWLMFVDYWKLCQKLWEPEDTNEYWQGVVKEVGVFSEKHKATGFAVFIAIGLFEFLEGKYKDKEK